MLLFLLVTTKPSPVKSQWAEICVFQLFGNEDAPGRIQKDTYLTVNPLISKCKKKMCFFNADYNSDALVKSDGSVSPLKYILLINLTTSVFCILTFVIILLIVKNCACHMVYIPKCDRENVQTSRRTCAGSMQNETLWPRSVTTTEVLFTRILQPHVGE